MLKIKALSLPGLKKIFFKVLTGLNIFELFGKLYQN